MITTSIIPIGNSKGIRIPKPILEASGLVKNVFITLQEGGLVIKPVEKKARKGWEKDAKKLSTQEKQEIFSGNNNFDITDWQWK